MSAGLYIHIPFCRSKCPYCDFYSLPSLFHLPDFIQALFREIEIASEEWERFDTVYIGGGTPSLLSPSGVEEILRKIRRRFLIAEETEITLEANPADLDGPSLHRLRSAGVNRLSLGVQSFAPEVLQFLGRRHSRAEAIAAIRASRQAGFDNLGVDLIYGIPGQEISSWQETLKQAVLLAPEHISCYQLTLEPGTPMGMRQQSGALTLPDAEEQYEIFMRTSAFLEDAGYIHYEVSNFARGMKYASRHNQKYWTHAPYLGLGPAAHSFCGNRRWWNHRSLEAYLQALQAGDPPIQESETLTPEELRLEAFYLGLRTKKGIALEEFSRRFHCDLLLEKQHLFARLEEEGLIGIQGGRLFPTGRGLAVADSLATL